MNFYAEFLTVVILHLLAVMSPGPDFFMITRNSLVYSRKTGLYSAVGLALGILVHVTYSIVGIAYVISKSIIVFSALKFLGAGYLIYIGYQALKTKPQKQTSENYQTAELRNLDRLAAIKMGFLTNVFNPKVTLFFLALFTQVIHASTPLWLKILYGAEMSGMTFVWFGFVALVMSHGKIRQTFRGIQHYVERSLGAVLILLGLKVALAKR